MNFMAFMDDKYKITHISQKSLGESEQTPHYKYCSSVVYHFVLCMARSQHDQSCLSKH